MTDVVPTGDPNGGLLNQSPRPRILVIGFDNAHGRTELISELKALAPTVEAAPNLTAVRHAEWDVVVTDRPFMRDFITDRAPVRGVGMSPVPREMNIIYRVDHTDYAAGSLDVSDGTYARRVTRASGRRGRELRRPSGLPETIAALTKELLEPVCGGRESHEVFTIVGSAGASVADILGGGPRSAPKPVTADTYELQPFLMLADGGVLAGRYRRTAKSEAWLLPHDVEHLVPWVKLALGEWHRVDPERFPGQPGWSEDWTWQTPEEDDLRRRAEEVERERVAILSDLAKREAEIAAELEVVSAAADQYERGLLTLQNDELVAAVRWALTEIGFDVEDSDTLARPGDYLQDMVVRDSELPEWVVLGEVKGYTKGAKTEVVAQFTRFAMRYVSEHGREPNALWYLVNQFLGRDPNERQPALHGKDDDVKAFAELGGLVIDTVQLFRLLMAVRRRTITSWAARSGLRDQTGRYVSPVGTR